MEKLRLVGLVSHKIRAGEVLQVPKGKVWLISPGTNINMNGSFMGSGVGYLKLSEGLEISANNNNNTAYVFGLEFDYVGVPKKIKKSKNISVNLKNDEGFRVASPNIFKGFIDAGCEGNVNVLSIIRQGFLVDTEVTKQHGRDGVISGVLFEIG